MRVNPNAPGGQFIGDSGKRLWKKGRYLSGEKILSKTQRRAAKEEKVKTGYSLPNYASRCVLVNSSSPNILFPLPTHHEGIFPFVLGGAGVWGGFPPPILSPFWDLLVTRIYPRSLQQSTYAVHTL